MDSETKKILRESGSISAVGLEMGFSVVIGYLFGHWLDGKFGTAPVLTLVFLFFGLGAAFMAIWRVYKIGKRIGNEDKSENGETGN